MDGSRGIAILLVMVLHIPESNHIYSAAGAITRPLLAVVLYGWAGVDLFFVLSGFLITGILLNAKHSPDRFVNFYMRPVLRIFPLYYAVLVLLFVIAAHVLRLYTEGIQAAWQHQWWYGPTV
jgi:peptidoglycan/LPS O-acetylase OafA/YrhL